jgi:hypothetical protein
MLRPRVLLDASGAREPRLMRWETDLGSSWGWGGWPLLYGRASTCVASDATDHPTIPIWWDGLSSGSLIWSYLLERFGTTEVC